MQNNLEILRKGSLPSCGSVLTVIQPLQLDEHLMETLSARIAFDMTTPELAWNNSRRMYLPQNDNDDGNDVLSDSGSVSLQPFDDTHQSQPDILCDNMSVSLQTIDDTLQSRPGSESKPATAKTIETWHKSPITELERSDDLVGDSTDYIEHSLNGFSNAGITHSLLKYVDTRIPQWRTETYTAQEDDYDSFSLCSQ